MVGVGVGVGSRAALHSRLPPKKRTRSRAPAQHCVHACYLAHTRSRATGGVGSWGGVGGGVYKRSGAKKARVQRH